MKVILASASPRRQALLQQIGITPLVCPADFAEGSGTASLTNANQRFHADILSLAHVGNHICGKTGGCPAQG